MNTMKLKGVLSIVCLISCVDADTNGTKSDHCVSYNATLDDKTLLTNSTEDAAGMTDLKTNWYKVTASEEGVMVRECLKGNECGTSNQAWMLDDLPTAERATVVNVTICIREGNNCCARNFTIEMQNYAHTKYLKPDVPSSSRPTSETTTSANITQTLPTTQKDNSSSPIGLIAGIAAGVILAAVIIGTVLIVRRRTRTDIEGRYIARVGVNRTIFDISALGADILINRRLADFIDIRGELGAKRLKFNASALNPSWRSFSAPPAL